MWYILQVSLWDQSLYENVFESYPDFQSFLIGWISKLFYIQFDFTKKFGLAKINGIVETSEWPLKNILCTKISKSGNY